MRVFLGSDHAGFELKARLVEQLTIWGHEPIDCGARVLDPADDYPAPCIEAASRTAREPGALGVVIGGSGNGEQIAANKVRGVRAALIWSDETARLARAHNDANVAAIGARDHSVQDAVRLLEIFLATPFSGDRRHLRRIAQIAEFEATGRLSGPESGGGDSRGRDSGGRDSGGCPPERCSAGWDCAGLE